MNYPARPPAFLRPVPFLGEPVPGLACGLPACVFEQQRAKVADVMGTAVVSVLVGHSLHCHAAALFGDSVAVQMLGIGPDRLPRHPCARTQEDGRGQCARWLKKHLLPKIEPLPRHAYVLDIDSTVKPVYGSQEGAENGVPQGRTEIDTCRTARVSPGE